MRKLHFKKKRLIVSTAILTAFLTNGVMAAETNVAKSEQPVAETTKSINKKLAKKKALEEQAIEVIEVTGLRGSLEAAQFLKRHSNAVIEVISAEDIGQFSDLSLTDALERVPGVQIERDDSGQSGDSVSIRGLGGSYVSSTINNRIMLSSGNGGLSSLRRANYNVLPPDVFQGVEVRKTATAVHPESGMAGQIDKQTLRPLDSLSLKKTNSLMRVGYDASTNDLADGVGQTLKAVLAFNNEDESLGYFLSAVKGESHRGSDQVRTALTGRNYRIDNDGDGIFSDPTAVFAEGNDNAGELINPDSTDYLLPRVMSQGNVLMNPIREESNREAVALGVQWRPTDDIDIMVDVAYSLFDNHSFRERGIFVINKPWDAVWPATALNIVGGDQTNYLTSADWNAQPINNKGEPVVPYFQASGQDLANETSTTVGGINAIYYGDRLTSEIDIYYSGVRHEGTLLDGVNISNLSQNMTMDTSGIFPVFTGVGESLLDKSTYEHVSTTSSQNLTDGDHYGIAIDFNYALGWDHIDSIDFGARYHNTKMDVMRSGDDRFEGKALKIYPGETGSPWQYGPNGEDWTTQEMMDAMLDAQVSGQATNNNMFDGESGFDEWLAVDAYAGCAVVPEICEYTLDNGGLALSKRNSFTMEESVFAAYVQLNLEGELAGMPFSGNVGIRAVETKDKGNAWKYETVNTFDEVLSAVETEGEYWTYLPSLNLRLLPTDDTAVRFAMNKTMTRGDLKDIAPNINTKYDEAKIEEGTGYLPSAKMGNPDLKPMTAISYDLTLEWYNSHKGAYAFSMFYKDISNYILNQRTVRTLPDSSDNQLWYVTQAINYSSADVKGFEVGFYQPFTFLEGFWSSFGARANYTWIDSNIEPSTTYDAELGTDPTNAGFGFPGVSENNVNVSLFYQKRPLTVRLTYVYRDDYFRSIATCATCSEGVPSIKRFTEGNSTFSLNANYTMSKHLRFNAAITNLTDNYRRDYSDEPSHFLDYYSRGRTYRIGMSYSF